MNALQPFVAALRLIGRRRQAYFWGVSAVRGLLSLLDLGALLLLTLAVNVLTADVNDSGNLRPEINQVVSTILSITSVSRANLGFLLASVVLVLFVSKAIASAVMTARMNQHLARWETFLTSRLAGALFNEVTLHGRVSPERASYAMTFGTSAMVSRGLGAISTIVAETLALAVTVSVLVAFQPLTTAIAFLYFGAIGAFLISVFGSKIENLGRLNTDGLNQANSFVRDTLGTQRELFLAGRLDEAKVKLTGMKRSASRALGSAISYASMPRFVIETALVIGAFSLAAFEFRFFDLETALTGLTVFLAGGARMVPSLLMVMSGVSTLRQVRSDADVALELSIDLKLES